MPERNEIEILISPEGYLKYHVQGIKGTRCVNVMKDMVKDTGRIDQMTYTSEYYQKEEVKGKERIKTTDHTDP